MSHTPYAKEVKAVAAILDAAEHETVEDLATAVLEKAFELFGVNHAKHIVVGQLIDTPPRAGLSREQKSEVKVALGPFATRSAATAAGKSLALSTTTGEQYRWWCLPLHKGTPAEWHAQRKKVYQPEMDGQLRLPWVEEWEKANG